jgi:hypothetical protein
MAKVFLLLKRLIPRLLSSAKSLPPRLIYTPLPHSMSVIFIGYVCVSVVIDKIVDE